MRRLPLRQLEALQPQRRHHMPAGTCAASKTEHDEALHVKSNRLSFGRMSAADRVKRRGSITNRRRLEVRPFGFRSSKPPEVIRQWPLPPNSVLLDEICERPLTKYIGHCGRKVPAAGVGRSRTVAELKCGRSAAVLQSRWQSSGNGCFAGLCIARGDLRATAYKVHQPVGHKVPTGGYGSAPAAGAPWSSRPRERPRA